MIRRPPRSTLFPYRRSSDLVVLVAELGIPWPVRGILALAGSLLSQAVISALQDWASKRAQDRRTAESSESSEIYDSLVGKELEGLRVHHSDHDDSEFLPRDAQKKTYPEHRGSHAHSHNRPLHVRQDASRGGGRAQELSLRERKSVV